MTVTNHTYQQELRRQFLQKITDDWEPRFGRHGESFVDLLAIQNKNGFVGDVCEAVEAELTRQVGATEAEKHIPSKDTFRRLLFAYDPKTRWHTKTRTALCLYVGFAGWEAFEDSRRVVAEEEPVPQPPTYSGAVRRTAPLYRNIALSALILLTGLTAWALLTPHRPADYRKANLSIQKREGSTVPTTILFQYDVHDLPFDSAFLCVQGCVGCPQRIPIRQATGRYSVTYMVSGIKRVVLEINGKPARQLSFPVYTNGWGGRIITPNRFYPYQTQEQIIQNGTLHIPSGQFSVPDEYNNYETHFSNCRDFGIVGDSSLLEVRVRNNPADGGLGCCDIGWTLSDAEGQSYEVHILQKSCTTFAQLQINGQVYTPAAHFNLLATLGQDVSQWGVLKIALINRELRVLFNEKPVLAVPYKGHIGRVKHLSCKFMGSGRVDAVKLSNTYSGQVAYEAGF